MNKSDLYEIKAKDHHQYVDLMLKMMLLYIAVVGALLKFTMTENTIVYYKIIAVVGLLYCIWACFLIYFHLQAAKSLKKSLDSLALELGIMKHVTDVKRLVQIGYSLFVFNFGMLSIFIVLLFLEPNAQSTSLMLELD